MQHRHMKVLAAGLAAGLLALGGVTSSVAAHGGGPGAPGSSAKPLPSGVDGALGSADAQVSCARAIPFGPSEDIPDAASEAADHVHHGSHVEPLRVGDSDRDALDSHPGRVVRQRSRQRRRPPEGRRG